MLEGMEHHLTRLGLSRAALKAAVLSELEEGGVDEKAEVIASAVADAVDANNQEVLRQLRELLTAEAAEALGTRTVGPESR
jgi:hypothetical protein